jgi:transcriptional regulator with XRE-family HTH domain
MISTKERLAANLKKIRTKKREESNGEAFSQTDLAERADLSRTYIAQVENGYTSPSFDAVDRMAKALDVDPSEFFKPIKV